MNKVSIVVPVYNVELYIEQCLESLIHQTYEDLEILLIDDGSTDRSGHICDSYAEHDNRIKVIHQKNAGAANAKNAGLDASTGKYLTFIDSDDFVEPNWIEAMVDKLEDAQADMVECNFDLCYRNRFESVKEHIEYEGVFNSEEYLAQYLNLWTCSLFWNKLFKRSLTEDIRFRRERRCIDDEFYTYKVLSNANKICRISTTLYHYRQRASSAVKNEKHQLQITDDALEVLVERYQWIKKRFKKLRKVYLKHDVDFLLYFDSQGRFDKCLIKKYREIANYYLRESLTIIPDKILLVNWWQLLKRIPIVNKLEVNTAIIGENNYFK